MQVTDLVVEVRNVDLERTAQLTEDDLDTLIVVPRTNDVGSWQITLPERVLNEASGAWEPHKGASDLRTEGAGLIITGPDGVLLSGPMLSATFEAKDTDASGSWTFTGVSDAVILADALAFPDTASADPNVQARSNDTRTGSAEDLLRDYVRFNIGPNAHAARRTGFRSLLTLDGPSLARGATLSKSPRFTNLLELLREIAFGGGLRFDVVQDGPQLRFTVWEPADRTASVRMDVDNDLLTSIAYGYGAPAATYAIVAGQGEGTARSILSRSSSASVAAEDRWGRRIERFVDQRQTDDLAELAQAGDDLLAAGGETVTGVRATPADDDTMAYLKDWRVGDSVSVVVEGQEVAAGVTEVALKVNGPAVLLTATLGDPAAFDPDAAADAQQTSTVQRVSSLERNAEAVAIAAGLVMQYAGADTPTGGWLRCDGAVFDPDEEPDLFEAIGTTFGGTEAAPRLPTLTGALPFFVKT